MGHLSSSSKTEVTCVGPAQLNCTALRELIISDFAELAKKISETNSDEETDRLYFVHPQECTAYFFDKHTQQQILTIKDSCNRHISVTAKYTAEHRTFISTLETIGSKMLRDKQKITSYWHRCISKMADRRNEIFFAAADTMRYIRLCTQKLALYSAINNMEKKTNDI